VAVGALAAGRIDETRTADVAFLAASCVRSQPPYSRSICWGLSRRRRSAARDTRAAGTMRRGGATRSVAAGPVLIEGAFVAGLVALVPWLALLGLAALPVAFRSAVLRDRALKSRGGAHFTILPRGTRSRGPNDSIHARCPLRLYERGYGSRYSRIGRCARSDSPARRQRGRKTTLMRIAAGSKSPTREPSLVDGWICGPMRSKPGATCLRSGPADLTPFATVSENFDPRRTTARARPRLRGSHARNGRPRLLGRRTIASCPHGQRGVRCLRRR
jgi:hypothetical protein